MLAVVIAAIAILVFVSDCVIAWPQAIIHDPGRRAGRLCRRLDRQALPQNAVRAFVVGGGVFLAFYYFTKG